MRTPAPDRVRLTVLGKSPSWQDADGACSGYLVEEDDTTVVIDCGNGVFSKLRRFRDYTRVDAVVISHLHADHFLDLVPFSYALTYAPRQQPVPVHRWPGTDKPARPRLIAPPGAVETFRRVVGAWGNEDLIENAFDIEEYAADDTPEVGPLKFSFQSVPHFTETFAIRVGSTDGGGVLVYGADSRPSEDLVEFVRDADLLLVEATLPRPERTGMRGHLTPREAGEHGRKAGVKRVVLTHISDELDACGRARRRATRSAAPVDVAREGAVYTSVIRLARLGSLQAVARDRDLFANFERMRREIDELFGDVFERSGLDLDARLLARAWTSTTRASRRPRWSPSIWPASRSRACRSRSTAASSTIAGHRRAQESEGRLYQQIEIPHGPFRRVVELGADVAADAARATYEDGMLRVEIPLAVEQRRAGRQVPISGARRGGESCPSEHPHRPARRRAHEVVVSARCPTGCRSCRSRTPSPSPTR